MFPKHGENRAFLVPYTEGVLHQAAFKTSTFN